MSVCFRLLEPDPVLRVIRAPIIFVIVVVVVVVVSIM